MAERGLDVYPDLGLVALQGGRANPTHRDRREPVVEPPADREGAGASLQDDTDVSLALQGTHLGDDVDALGAGHVTSVAPTVLLLAHRHEAVPSAVLVLVDGGLAPGALPRRRRWPTPRGRAVSFLGVRHRSLPTSLAQGRRPVSRCVLTPPAGRCTGQVHSTGSEVSSNRPRWSVVVRRCRRGRVEAFGRGLSSRRT